MNQLVVLLIFAAIAVINSLIRKSAAATKRRPGTFTPPPPNNPPATQRPVQSQQDTQDARLRQFMEALGVPAGAAPPPRPVVRPQPVARRSQPAVRRPIIPRRVVVPQITMPSAPPEQPRYQVETTDAQSPAKTDYEMATASSAAATGVSPAGGPGLPPAVDFKSLLRSPSSIRAAIVLKEILGAPKGLQPLGDLPGLR